MSQSEEKNLKPINNHEMVNKEEFQNIISKVKTAEITYAIVECPNKDLEVFNIKESEKKSGGVEKIRKEEELRESFDNLKKDVKKLFEEKKSAFYIPYDFGFYIDEENYRTVVILICFLPESLKPTKKVFYSFSKSSFLSLSKISRSFDIFDLEDLSYDSLLTEIKLIRNH